MGSPLGDDAQKTLMMGKAGLGALPSTWARWAHLMPLVRVPVGRGQSLGEPRGGDTRDTPAPCGKQLLHWGLPCSDALVGHQSPELGPTAPCPME